MFAQMVFKKIAFRDLWERNFHKAYKTSGIPPVLKAVTQLTHLPCEPASKSVKDAIIFHAHFILCDPEVA